ncbi:MAG TPA: bifunctional nuclease family protein [Anaerolineales bacterium]|nr:bifunctional nuclease family protein [Anaerolineae bacterium]HIQ00663.1 bifunctional nuclease family protein [Anaerolineales bacterium]
MIEVKIAGIQVSLMSQHRVVLLKELDTNRYLPIWIGPYEAEAINIELQRFEVGRPLTHDLLKNTIEALGGTVQYVVVSELREDTFYARIIIDVDGQEIDIDARPSDAMALAVRVRVPIYVAEEVMTEAGIVPERDLSKEGVEREERSAFDEFLDSLDIDDLPIH